MSEHYRKKPVVVEAVQWKGDIPTFEAFAPGLIDWEGSEGQTDSPLMIETLEGTMRADIGDWVIRGIKGELYPCKPDIFEMTYEPVPFDNGTSTATATT